MLTKFAAQTITTAEVDPSNSMRAGQSLVVGQVIALSDSGNPLIAYDQQTQVRPLEALTLVTLDRSVIGREVAISFAQNRDGMPIVMGVIKRLLNEVLAAQPAPEPIEDELKPEVLVNGQKLELVAAEEITLRCGKSSITLTKEGKILIKGEHMLNRTAGSYKIKSGSIQLN